LTGLLSGTLCGLGATFFFFGFLLDFLGGCGFLSGSFGGFLFSTTGGRSSLREAASAVVKAMPPNPAATAARVIMATPFFRDFLPAVIREEIVSMLMDLLGFTLVVTGASLFLMVSL
jgi:hypothetical protein